MTSQYSVVQHLRQALTSLQNGKKWIKGSYYNDRESHCAVGAIRYGSLLDESDAIY